MLRDFKAPNVNGPRFRPTSLNLLNKAFYESVRKENKELSKLTDKEIKNIIQTACKVLQEKVIELRDGVELPQQLGYIFIGSTPATKDRNVDYKTSIALGKLVHHKNWDTDGLTGKIFYTNFEQKYRFKFHELWQFSPVRQFKKAVSLEYPKDYTKYVRVDNWLKVSRLFRKNRAAERIRNFQKKQIKSLTDYDEFKLD